MTALSLAPRAGALPYTVARTALSQNGAESMFVGHMAVAFAAKSVSPRTSLGLLIGAATAADLLWPLFLLGGIEQVRIAPGATAFTPLVFVSYPWSHSLLMLTLWGLLLGVIARWRGAEPRSLWLITVLAISHWVLDFVTHAPDMPLWPGTSPRFGLGLWNSIRTTLIIEGVLWVTCLTIYLRRRAARNWIGRVALWSLVGISTVMWASGPWSPPPTSEQGLAWFALIGWIIVPWAIWADRGYIERAA